MNMKKHILGGILLCAMLALSSFAARAEDVIRFGVAAEPYPPFASKDAGGLSHRFQQSRQPQGKDRRGPDLHRACPLHGQVFRLGGDDQDL
jgi:ABC-type amino acid transport substrate-binding protein